MEVGRLRWGQLLRDLAWALTTVVAGNDVGQCCCRAVKDLRTWHAVNRTINLPSHRTISALLEELGRLPNLDGERLNGCVWEMGGLRCLRRPGRGVGGAATSDFPWVSQHYVIESVYSPEITSWKA